MTHNENDTTAWLHILSLPLGQICEKQAPLVNGSMAPLPNSSSTSLWRTGLWAVATLILNCVKLWNNRGWHVSSCRCPWIILSTLLFKVMLLHWSRNWRKIPMTSILPRFCRASTCTYRGLPATMMTLSPSLQLRLFGQGPTTTIQHRPFFPIKATPGIRSGFATCHWSSRLNHAKARPEPESS